MPNNTFYSVTNSSYDCNSVPLTLQIDLIYYLASLLFWWHIVKFIINKTYKLYFPFIILAKAFLPPKWLCLILQHSLWLLSNKDPFVQFFALFCSFPGMTASGIKSMKQWTLSAWIFSTSFQVESMKN